MLIYFFTQTLTRLKFVFLFSLFYNTSTIPVWKLKKIVKLSAGVSIDLDFSVSDCFKIQRRRLELGRSKRGYYERNVRRCPIIQSNMVQPHMGRQNFTR